MLNDEELADHSLLLITEPYLFTDREGHYKVAPQHHTCWTPILPETTSAEERPRAMIWAHKEVTARLIPSTCRDIAAVTIELSGRTILVLSVYVQTKTDTEDAELQTKLDQVRALINHTRRNHRGRVEIILSGDFNRHDQLWGGDDVGLTPRQGEGEPIIQIMSDLDLQILLPRGTITWHSDDGDHQSTIDLIMATPELTEEVTSCTTADTQHGSDHTAVRTTFSATVDFRQSRPRKIWKKAKWSQINATLSLTLQSRPNPDQPGDVDSYWDYLQEILLPTLNKYVPEARPSPHQKRWWTENLTQLRKDYSYWRNRASAIRRSGPKDPALESMASSYKKRFHDAHSNKGSGLQSRVGKKRSNGPRSPRTRKYSSTRPTEKEELD